MGDFPQSHGPHCIPDGPQGEVQARTMQQMIGALRSGEEQGQTAEGEHYWVMRPISCLLVPVDEAWELGIYIETDLLADSHRIRHLAVKVSWLTEQIRPFG
mmetsp:Transcript_98135/g.165314  ORF Transcript_98135/g.165314 Transcript_98135/m.165314 type:complete len:101 (-) Transcript_98135:16-318(-)